MIIRAPHRAGFTIVDNKIAQSRDLSRRAKGLLLELLSHTDGWATDSDSLAAAGPEGRDAIRKTLAELESHGYLLRLRRQDARGRWRTDSYVFDSPVPPGFDPVALLDPTPDPPQLSTGPGEDPVEEDPVDERLFEHAALSQVKPTTGNPSSVAPTTGSPTTGKPSVGRPVAKNKKTNQKTNGVEAASSVQGARAGDADAPQNGSPASAPATPGRPDGWDEFGPLEPNCREHRDGYGGPCAPCGIARTRWAEAQPKRAAKIRRERAAAEIEADRRDAAQRARDEDQARRAAEAREAIRRAAEERRAAEAAASRSGATQ